MRVVIYLVRYLSNLWPAIIQKGGDGGGAPAFSTTWRVRGAVEGASRFSNILSVSE
jgi:hypothetical protein